MDKYRSHSDITKTFLLAGLLFLLWTLKFLVILILAAFILTVILMPFVRRLRKLRLPALFAVIIPLATLTAVSSALFIYFKPILVDEFPRFINEVVAYARNLSPNEQFDISLSSVGGYRLEQFGNFANVAVNIGSVLAQALVAILTLLVIVMYWLSGYEKINQTLISYVPKTRQKLARDILKRIEFKLGKWFLGQVLISIAVGVAVWLAALALGLPYAGVLAIIAGLLEIVPTIGPIIASLPAIALGATESLEKAVIVVIVYLVIQQLENHVLAPILLGRTINMHPIMIIVSFISGALLFGLIGALLAVPVALIISSFIDNARQEPMPI